MGVHLVAAACGPEWAHLSDRARVVLFHMAIAALDTDNGETPAATWWKGLDSLILDVLGLDPGELSSTAKKTAFRKIQRAVQELREAGAIELLQQGHNGHPSVYRVCSQPVLLRQNPVDNPN